MSQPSCWPQNKIDTSYKLLKTVLFDRQYLARDISRQKGEVVSVAGRAVGKLVQFPAMQNCSFAGDATPSTSEGL